MEKVVELRPKAAAVQDNTTQDERQMILATLENVMTFQEKLEQGMKLMTLAFSELQAHVRDLQHEVTELKKKKKPTILNAVGERAN